MRRTHLIGALRHNAFGVRRQSEAATALSTCCDAVMSTLQPKRRRRFALPAHSKAGANRFSGATF